MNRTDFMKELERLLQNISPAEREEALQYYNEYFNDAGEENEQSVIEALGTPAKVAENIKRDLYGSGYGEAVFQKSIPNDKALVECQSQNYENKTVENEVLVEIKNSKLPTWAIVLIIVLCILAAPIILSVASGIIGVLVGIVTAWFGMIFGFGVAAIALIIVMLAMAITGVIIMFSDFLVGIAVLGGGLLCGGLGLLFLMLTVALAGIATPAICRGIVSLCRMIFKKKNPA